MIATGGEKTGLVKKITQMVIAPYTAWIKAYEEAVIAGAVHDPALIEELKAKKKEQKIEPAFQPATARPTYEEQKLILAVDRYIDALRKEKIWGAG